jgi:hypothetical protein
MVDLVVRSRALPRSSTTTSESYLPFSLGPASSEKIRSRKLVVVGAIIALLGFAMSLGGFAWGLAGGEWWPGPTLVNGFGWPVLGVGVALAVVGLVRRSRSGTHP